MSNIWDYKIQKATVTYVYMYLLLLHGKGKTEWKKENILMTTKLNFAILGTHLYCKICIRSCCRVLCTCLADGKLK